MAITVPKWQPVIDMGVITGYFGENNYKLLHTVDDLRVSFCLAGLPIVAIFDIEMYIYQMFEELQS